MIPTAHILEGDHQRREHGLVISTGRLVPAQQLEQVTSVLEVRQVVQLPVQLEEVQTTVNLSLDEGEETLTPLGR